MKCLQLNFIEWLRLDESRSKTFVAPKKPKLKKSRPQPTVHHDLDSWLSHVDNLKKELELLKDKLKDKKPGVTKPPEEPKKVLKKPEEEEKEKEDDDTEQPDEKPEEDKEKEKVVPEKDSVMPPEKNSKVLSPVMKRKVVPPVSVPGRKPVPEE
jgi:hypothetical protein